jgi:hypothetical protein
LYAQFSDYKEILRNGKGISEHLFQDWLQNVSGNFLGGEGVRQEVTEIKERS